jgi:hypothetical protein
MTETTSRVPIERAEPFQKLRTPPTPGGVFMPVVLTGV